jgi:hypothetical protein
MLHCCRACADGGRLRPLIDVPTTSETTWLQRMPLGGRKMAVAGGALQCLKVWRPDFDGRQTTCGHAEQLAVHSHQPGPSSMLATLSCCCAACPAAALLARRAERLACMQIHRRACLYCRCLDATRLPGRSSMAGMLQCRPRSLQAVHKGLQNRRVLTVPAAEMRCWCI